MKTLLFSYPKRPILHFSAENVDFAREKEAFLLQAQGEISFQDTPALEELMYVHPACQFSVTEAGEELLHGHYSITILVLEPDQLVARITPES